MKRILTCVLTLAALAALAVPAFADIMWEPMDNAFYYKHQAQCQYENRSYYANGPDGFVTLWDAPDGSMVRAQFENGETLRVYFIYNRDWCLCAYWMDGEETSGWVPLSELELVYDYLCFREEYGDRITPYSGEFADYAGSPAAVSFYAYPGAPEISASFDLTGQPEILRQLTGSADSSSAISSIFVDEDGRTWGYVGYLYGCRNVWFCLDEPEGTDFPVREVASPSLIPAQPPVLPAASYVPYALVGAVVVVTAGLLYVFYGRRQKAGR